MATALTSDSQAPSCRPLALRRDLALPLLFIVPQAIFENVRHWVSFNPWEVTEIGKLHLSTDARLDAPDAHVVIPLQVKRICPNFRAEHAIVADLDDIDPAPDALVPG